MSISLRNLNKLALLRCHQTLADLALQSIETKSLQHRLVVKPIQIHCLTFICKVLVLMPSRHTENVAFLPGELLAIDLRIAGALNDMIHRGSSLFNSRRAHPCIQALCKPTKSS